MSDAMAEAINKLNAALERTEQILSERFTLGAKVLIEPNLFLGFAKLQGEWRLFLNDPTNKQPIRHVLQVSLGLRVKAADHVPHLVRALIDEQKYVELGADKTVARLHAFLDAAKAAQEAGKLDAFIDQIFEVWSPIMEGKRELPDAESV